MGKTSIYLCCVWCWCSFIWFGVGVPILSSASSASVQDLSRGDQASPERIFRQAVAAWQSQPDHWDPWKEFSSILWNRFESLSASESSSDKQQERLDVVGAFEEGILSIERIVFQQGQGGNPKRDAALSDLYMTYARALSHLSPEECHSLALDPHTLLIGAETVQAQSEPSAHLCIENAENSIRNAVTLDATNQQAAKLLHELTGGETVHKRKPKEFVAELFDSFADSFDDKLLNTLEYKVPELAGRLASKLSQDSYVAVLDAGCGTGLAGRFLRPHIALHGVLVGVDASQKMLDKAKECTRSSGCGLIKTLDQNQDIQDNEPLYDALLQLDLEDMTTDNTLRETTDSQALGFDLVVATDVLVYFGSLESLLMTFARLSVSKGYLIFSCELATDSEAPLGWRLLPSGRFSHTKQHALDMATRVHYDLVSYEEIVPRIEKGEAVRGHLFAFQKRDSGTSWDEQPDL